MLALVLIVGSMVFFTLFEQAGSSLNQFAERNTSLPNNGFWTIDAGPDPVVQRRLHPDLRAGVRLALGAGSASAAATPIRWSSSAWA